MPGNGKGSSWRHCRLVTSHHATWSCLLSVSNALSTAYLLLVADPGFPTGVPTS